jgi:hypothetical protein
MSRFVGFQSLLVPQFALMSMNTYLSRLFVSLLSASTARRAETVLFG